MFVYFFLNMFLNLRHLTLSLLYITKPHKNYHQHTQHVVLRNRPTLSIGTESLLVETTPVACSWGPSPSTRQVPGSSPGPGGRAARAFFLHPHFLPPSGDSFFRTFSHQTHESVRVIIHYWLGVLLLYTTGWVYY